MAGTQVENKPFAEMAADFRRDPFSLCWRVPGIWLLDKPSGPSSNLMVMRARRALGTKKIGHAGTLDPMASGLLVLLAGNATRLFDSIQEFPKSYLADFRFGERTDSQDATGSPLPGWSPTRPAPDSREEVEEALGRFRGGISQVPPMHSALKKDGQPLYKLARKGETVERAARPATVYNLALCDLSGSSGRLAMTVSKGFYVRTLIDDLGLALGCGAVMTALSRTGIGPFSLAEAVALDGLAGRRVG